MLRRTVYSLLLKCSAEQVDLLSGELWETGTVGIQEWDHDGVTELIAGFEGNAGRQFLLQKFSAFDPSWRQESSIDWVEHSQAAWPAREIGERICLAPKWSQEPTPPGRVRLIHNPGLACGTGEHPCTQLALCAIETALKPAATVVDVGAGSGILAVAAALLGAGSAIAIDTDQAALAAACENFELNGIRAKLVTGSADCISDGCADLTVANINATVLLAILDELRRITRPDGVMILTGFTDAELAPLQGLFAQAEVSGLSEWRCLTINARLRTGSER